MHICPSLSFNLAVRPEITRSEIDLIWSCCHLKGDGNLDFYQFLREFGYSKGSAHYPNTCQHPPRRGDADLVLTSKKLYADSILVQGNVRHLIRRNWQKLREEFAKLDPYRTGYVQPEEFAEILSELCPAINEQDLYLINSKLHTENDHRMNYVRFLKCHAPHLASIALLRQSTERSLSTIDERTPRPSSDRLLLNHVSLKLRRKERIAIAILFDAYKQLRRTFKEHDQTNGGSVSLKTFQNILNQYQCPLNDEQFYALASQIDTKLDGTVNYNYLLQQYIKNS